jgi:uncharacterized coiled-coil protein SlyX
MVLQEMSEDLAEAELEMERVKEPMVLLVKETLDGIIKAAAEAQDQHQTVLAEGKDYS